MSDKHAKRKAISSSITTVVSISLVLFMLGLLGLIILNTKKISDHVKENIAFQVILTDNTTNEDVAKVQKLIDASRYAKKTEFVDKETAAENLKKDLGEDFIQFLGYNPLLSSINVYLNADYANTDSIVGIEKAMLLNKKVKEVIYQKDLIIMVNDNVKKISLILLVVTGLLMLIALALINNTIRLSIYSKRFLIKTMQLVGATQGFIRRPFVLSGMLHGVYAAMIAIALLMSLLYFSEQQFPELVLAQDTNMLITLFTSVLLLGVLISGISTILAVRKYLLLKSEELYF